MPVWQFIDSGERTGAFNMRLDEALARSLARGEADPTIRLFLWKPWAISLGYNQRIEDIRLDRARHDGIDVVRRPTGGRAILHAEELTYSVVMPSGRRGVLQVYNAISEALVRGLEMFGVRTELQKSQPDFVEHYRHASSIPCFTASARYEIEWEGRKLVGSAQRRFAEDEHDVVLQHGSILCGSAHQRLTDYLQIDDADVLSRVQAEMRDKTVTLADIVGGPVDRRHLASCIRRGFEEAWGITTSDTPLAAINPSWVLSTDSASGAEPRLEAGAVDRVSEISS
jgi:lipoate-protein ligase A